MSGKYWAAAGQHKTILEELHENIYMQEFNKKKYIIYIELLEDTTIQDIE